MARAESGDAALPEDSWSVAGAEDAVVSPTVDFLVILIAVLVAAAAVLVLL